jgi:hypothetical protein
MSIYAIGEWTFEKDNDGHDYCIRVEDVEKFSEWLEDSDDYWEPNADRDSLIIRHEDMDFDSFAIGQHPMNFLKNHPECKIVGH